MEAAERYLIAGPYRLDLRDERLWREGAPVRLRGKAFALLRALMLHPQTLLTKDELFDTVWPGVTVSESVLTTAAKELRRAIGDSAREPQVIETVHGRGYRFLLPVERRAALEAFESPSQRGAATRLDFRWVAAVALLSLVIAVGLWLALRAPSGGAAEEAAPAGPHPQSVAVIPFADLSPGNSHQWFADGLTEEVLASLARTPDLRVASRVSSARFGGRDADLQQAARQLGVGHILQGSVRNEGERVRVTAGLIRASDGTSIWSQSYDRSGRGIIDIQEQIAFAIASALKTVTDPSRLRAMVAAGTRSVEAYEAYLRGLSLSQRQLDEGDVSYASPEAEAYERARKLDPGFAEAHWRAAQTWFGRATRVAPSPHEELSDRARLDGFFERADAAIAASRNEVDRLRYRAAKAAIQLRVREAHRLMISYLRARPRDIDAWEQMADLAAWADERQWVARAAERIHTLSIEEGNPRSRAITVSVQAMALNEAVERARRQLELRPDTAFVQYQAHRAFIWAGRIDEARALLARIDGSRLPQGNRLLARLRQACAERRLEEAVRLRSELEPVGSHNARWVAAVMIGDEAGADALLRPLDTPERLPTLLQYMIYPTFDFMAYPNLRARLLQNGVAPRRPVRAPFACPPGTSRMTGSRSAANPPA